MSSGFKDLFFLLGYTALSDFFAGIKNERQSQTRKPMGLSSAPKNFILRSSQNVNGKLLTQS